jgi:methylated-DNA-[protein]-cysteine S-methyltransferase
MAYAQSAALIATPIGPVRIEAVGDVLTAIRIGDTRAASGASPVLRDASSQMIAYFDRRLDRFDLPLAPPSTARGADLRAAMCAVRFGQTRTYGDIAEEIGSSARAIGQACGRNSFPLVVPCHRILSAGSRLGHYSAGEGPRTKAFLLTHEDAKGWRA